MTGEQVLRKPTRGMLALFACLAVPFMPMVFGQANPSSVTAASQTAPSPAAASFDVADVHVSPYVRFPFKEGGNLSGDRYILRQATMTQIIAAAYNLDSTNVQGGPTWLDWDHFDIVAKAPSTTSKETIRLMLQSLLAQRFNLAVHSYLTKPVVDSTGLKGAYDFNLKWTALQQLVRAGSDGISIFDAVDKELGLKLTLETAPRPVLTVDSVSETPMPNPPDIAKRLPPLPPAQFEVATVKPSAPDEKPTGRINRDGLEFRDQPLKFLIYFAWDLDANATEQIVGAPKWLDEDKIDVEAKLAAADMAQVGAGRGTPPIALEDLRDMLKQLLIERFEMKVHTENLPEDAYTLVAGTPKMTKADPTERTKCDEGPGPDGKDPRLAHPILNMLVTCQNVSMAQAGALFPTFAAWYLHFPVMDKTGLKGGWDFMLSWSSGDHMSEFSDPSSPDSQGGASADPNGAVSFYDAVSKELGLKLVKEKRPEPVLVIDHIDEQPTAN